MSYWFAYRVFDRSIDVEPGASVIEGPFGKYEEAKNIKNGIRGSDMQKTSMFQAKTKDDAEAIAAKENYMVG